VQVTLTHLMIAGKKQQQQNKNKTRGAVGREGVFSKFSQ